MRTRRLLAPGLLVDASFAGGGARTVVTIPEAALIFETSGLHVATVTKDQTIRMVPIKIEHDLGEVAEPGKGLNGGERVVVNPPPGQKPHGAGGAS